MTIENLSDLGSKVSADLPTKAHYGKPAKGDGSCKPGDLVAIDETTQKVEKIAPGSQDRFDGILTKPYYGAVDDAVPDGSGCQVIFPKSGKRYRVACEPNVSGDNIHSETVTFSDLSNGRVKPAESGAENSLNSYSIGRLSIDYSSGDQYTEIYWGV